MCTCVCVQIIVLLTLIVLLVLTLIAYMIFTRDQVSHSFISLPLLHFFLRHFAPPPYSLPTQLDLIVQFALTKTGHIPTCSPLMNCAVLVSMAFIPIFPVTLLRVLTPMQITSTFGYMCVHYITPDTEAEGRVHIITDRAGTLDKQSPLDKSESGTGERLQYY